MAGSRLAWVASLASALVLCAGGSAMADTSVSAKLHPLNDSGAGGVVRLTATDDGRLVVVIRAHGLVPGQPHAQHIHGSLDGGAHFMCPSLKDDKNGDGVLTNEEAMGEYGTIFFSLTTHGDSSAKSALAADRMPVADSKGRLNYRRTFSAARVPDALLSHLSALHVVQHGIDVNHNGKYDMAALGESTFAKNLGAPGVPEEATDPATCGVVTGAGAPMAPHGGVETGGAAASGRSAPLAALGGLMVLASAGLLFIRVRSRGTGTAK
jgi:hypothetical protein